MPSKNMLPKGKRRQTVKHQYRETRTALNDEAEAAIAAEEAITVPEPPREPLSVLERTGTRTFTADEASVGMRLDAYLAKSFPDISRSRMQLLIDSGKVSVNGSPAKSKLKLEGGEQIELEGQPEPPPLKAYAENIPLTVVYEDKDLAVIDKPAGMMVHAGSGATEDARNAGTLVNALLHHFNEKLSGVGGELRPGIVHRLDKETSGLIVVAKNDVAHRALAEMFSAREVEKRYLALVHGEIGAKMRGNAGRDSGTISLPIARDPKRRQRMTTRIQESWLTTESHGTPGLRHPEEKEPIFERQRTTEARSAVSHYQVLERLHTSAGEFTLVEVRIETGRTHQIRVHMQSLGHPVVGDRVYGAPARIAALADKTDKEKPTLDRNFLHAANLHFVHPKTRKVIELSSQLPPALVDMLQRLRSLSLK